MATTLTMVPGVQIQEVRLAPPVITGVPTSIAGFIGKAPRDAQFVGVAKAITSADDFRAQYMLGTPAVPAVAAQPATIARPAIPASPAVAAVPDATQSTPLSHAVLGFFGNGGTKCYVVNVGTGNAADVVNNLPLLELIDEIAVIAAPGFPNQGVYTELIAQAARTGDRVAILDSPARADLLSGGATIPDLEKLISDAAIRPPASPDSIYSAFYYPRIIVGPELANDPKLDAGGEAVSPSGHIAGVFARVDATRGVHKAPANEVIRGAVGVEQVITDAQQNALNPNAVNVIRVFGGSSAPIIFGARTLQNTTAPNSDYTYLNVRRLVNYIEESIQDGLRWAVFEPNTLALRQQITRSVRGFLNGVWRDGGLFGETSDQAYYVRFPALFNRDEDRALGKLTLEIGLRVTFPAEFIIVRIGVILQDATTV